MMSLQNKLIGFGRGLAEIVDETYHYWRPMKSVPYAIWQEDGEDGSFDTNNRKAEQQIHGTLDYFTKKEFDEVVDDIQTYLNSLNDFGWRLNLVQYEEETNLIHFEWEWWII